MRTLVEKVVLILAAAESQNAEMIPLQLPNLQQSRHSTVNNKEL